MEIAALAEARVERGEFITVDEAAKYLNYDRRTVTNWLQAGKLRGTRIGRKWLVERSSLPVPTPSHRVSAGNRIEVGQCFRVWQGQAGVGYVQAISVEQIAPSQLSTVNLGPLGPEEELTRPAVEVLKLRPDDLVRFKIEVLDDIEVSLVETELHVPAPRTIRHKIDLFTKQSDPGLASTQFWLYGGNWQLKLWVRNPTKYATATARVRFSGLLIVTRRAEKSEGTIVSAVTRGWASQPSPR